MHIIMLNRYQFQIFNLIKTYLQTTMSQERLNGLTMISIENEYLDKLNFDNLIEELLQKMQGEIIFFEADHANYKTP